MSDGPAHAVQHHTPPTGFIRKYVFSLDHKVIGLQYYGLALVAVFIGMALSWLMRTWYGRTRPSLDSSCSRRRVLRGVS